MEEIPVYYHMEECQESWPERVSQMRSPRSMETARHNYPLSIWEKENDKPGCAHRNSTGGEELYYEDCFGLDEQKVMMLEKADATESFPSADAGGGYH